MKSTLLFVIVCVFTANYSVAEDIKPLVYLSGNNSKVSKQFYERITNADEMAKVWAQHLGTSKDDYYRPMFEVDFDRCMVVAILRGKQIQVRQVEVNSISVQKDSLIVRFTEFGYSIGATDKMPETEYKYPYVFVVLPKTDKEIVLVAGQPIKGRKPTTNWQEIVRLRADGTKRQPVQVKSDN